MGDWSGRDCGWRWLWCLRIDDGDWRKAVVPWSWDDAGLSHCGFEGSKEVLVDFLVVEDAGDDDDPAAAITATAK